MGVTPWLRTLVRGGAYAAAEAKQRKHRGYGTRTGLFDGYPDEVRWRWMAITPAEFARVRYIDYDYWVELSGVPGWRSMRPGVFRWW